jgi:hypothetical protein
VAGGSDIAVKPLRSPIIEGVLGVLEGKATFDVEVE